MHKIRETSFEYLVKNNFSHNWISGEKLLNDLNKSKIAVKS